MNRKQMLVGHARKRIQPAARSACQHNALHNCPPVVMPEQGPLSVPRPRAIKIVVSNWFVCVIMETIYGAIMADSDFPRRTAPWIVRRGCENRKASFPSAPCAGTKQPRPKEEMDRAEGTIARIQPVGRARRLGRAFAG